jgi:hypothetical protein
VAKETDSVLKRPIEMATLHQMKQEIVLVSVVLKIPVALDTPIRKIITLPSRC